MEDPRNRQYTNDEITVFWVPSKCIHATTCFRELIEVFNPGKRPWVNINAAPTRRIIEVVNKCPTQAIEWKYNKDMSEQELKANFSTADEVTPETLSDFEEATPAKRAKSELGKAEGRAKVTIMKDGPIVVEGEFKVIGPEGSELKSMVMTSFCRCGASRSMPFCDGTHRKIGFTDEI